MPPLTANEPIVIALYAGLSNDTCGLVGVTSHPTKPGCLAVRLVREWSSPRGSMLDFYGDANSPDRFIRNAILPNYAVSQILYDPRQLSGLCSRLIADNLVWCQPLDTTDRDETDKYMLDVILARRIAHDGNTALWQHLDNADRRIDQTGRKLSLAERTGAQPIDLARCLSACVLSAQDLGLGL